MTAHFAESDVGQVAAGCCTELATFSSSIYNAAAYVVTSPVNGPDRGVWSDISPLSRCL